MAKKRPALVLEVYDRVYKVCQITSKNRTGQFPGKWILKNSNIGRSMGILKDSFINMGRTVDVTEDYIDRKIGYYPDIDNLIKDMNN